MEVASIITSNKDLINLFKDFILSYSILKLQQKDNDTMYFSKCSDEKLEIYFHYLLNNSSEEFSYNYTVKDINAIKGYFSNKNIYIFDVSFRNEQFFNKMMHDFEEFLIDKSKKEVIKDILLSHPRNGIIGLTDRQK